MDNLTVKTQRPRSRKSIAHMPSPDTVHKENTTVDSTTLADAPKASLKKSRSKSIGPGGLDALKEITGNRREVGDLLLQTKQDPNPTLSGTTSNLCEIHFEAHNCPITPQADPTSLKCATTPAIAA